MGLPEPSEDGDGFRGRARYCISLASAQNKKRREVDGELRNKIGVSSDRKEHIMIQYWFPVIFLGGALVIAGIVERVPKT
jgi:hypothetical protein